MNFPLFFLIFFITFYLIFSSIERILYRLSVAKNMNPLQSGITVGAMVGGSLALINVVTKTFFQTGWIDWTFSEMSGIGGNGSA